MWKSNVNGYWKLMDLIDPEPECFFGLAILGSKLMTHFNRALIDTFSPDNLKINEKRSSALTLTVCLETKLGPSASTSGRLLWLKNHPLSLLSSFSNRLLWHSWFVQFRPFSLYRPDRPHLDRPLRQNSSVDCSWPGFIFNFIKKD